MPKIVLLVDDDEEFGKNVVAIARSYNIGITQKTNYRDMVQVLEKNAYKIDHIILDIICLIEPDQEIEKEDFLQKALNYLDQNFRDIPRLILTADQTGYDTMKNYFTTEKVFRKTKEDIIAALQHIDQVDTKAFKLRFQYRDIFDIITKNNLLPQVESQLLDLIDKLDSQRYTDLLDNLIKIRRIQESIFQKMNISNKDILPDDLFKGNNDIKFWEIHKHLKGNPTKENNYQPVQKVYYASSVEQFSEMIYKICSDNGAHNTFQTSDFGLSKYSVMAATYSLLEFIRWYGWVIEQNSIENKL